MRRHLSRSAWSFAWAGIVVSGLGACAMSPAYVNERLDSVPKPAAILMVRSSVPDCASPLAQVGPVATPKPKDEETVQVTAGTDFESEAAITEPAVVLKKKHEPGPGRRDAELKRLERERDCYRRAEQLARQRLEALQASSAEILAALDDIRNNPEDTGHLVAW